MREFMKNKRTFFNGRGKTLFSLIFIVILFQNCLDDDETDFERRVRIDNETITAYLESNNIPVKQDIDGYFYQKIKENSTGKSISDNDVLSIYYHMTLLNGEKVDSANATNGGPVKLGFDQRRVTLAPTGLYLGISTMREGEVYKFFMPSYLAYGSYTYKQLIPANSIFIIDVELVKIEDEDDQEQIEQDLILTYIEDQELGEVDKFSSGLFYKQLSAGDGAKPRSGDNLKVHYTGTYLDGTIFDETKSDSPWQFRLGSTSIIKGFEDGVKLMQEGEKAILIMPSSLAYGESYQVVPAQIKEDLIDKEFIPNSVDPFSPLVYEVELVDVN